MAATIKHKYTSTIPDGGDTSLVQPSNWNDTHDVTGTWPLANGGTNADLSATGPGFLKQASSGAAVTIAEPTATDVGLGNVDNTSDASKTATLVAATHTWALAQTFTAAPVFTDASGSRTALGLGTAAVQNTGTSGANVPLLNAANTWAGIQTLSVAPVFTDASGTRTAIGLGSVTNDAQTKAAIVPNTAPAAGGLLVGNAGGTAYAPVSASGDVTITSAGVTAIGSNKVTNAMLQNASMTIAGHSVALGGTQTISASDVGLGSVTNDAQTKASVVPNTTPTAGQIHVGNAGGTAFAAVSMSGDGTLASTGAISITKTGGVSFAASATTDTTNAANIGSGTLPNARLVAIPNSALANSAITINGTSVSLGGSISKGWITLDRKNVEQTVVTGTATKGTSYSLVVTGGTLNANGRLRITAVWRFTGATGTRTPGVDFGGTTFWQSVAVASSSLSFGVAPIQIANRNSVSAQIAMNIGAATTVGAAGVDVVTGSVNTAADQTLILWITLPGASDTGAVESVMVEYNND